MEFAPLVMRQFRANTVQSLRTLAHQPKFLAYFAAVVGPLMFMNTVY